MLFNSYQFLIFFPVVTVIYFLLPHKWRWLHLLIASCMFYMAFIPAYILILFVTILIDYAAGILIEDASPAKKRLFLGWSIFANIGVLAIFKYYNFFIDNVNGIIHTLGIATHDVPYLNIILPIGLSFHTFQAMSYTIEVYRGNQKAERHLGIYSLYVMFYPQLVAGPIERPQNLLHQFWEEHKFSAENLLFGLRLMLWGLFKKVVIADRLAVYVNSVYTTPDNYHWLNLVIATLCFTIQIYCDFSGYSDIAIGAARTMGFNLMVNFRRPYFSKNIQEFWSRWHISLSTWFRDYLYISLGGNRSGEFNRYRNVAIVFLVSGFWHGANWTFVIWGALHTLFIITYMLYNDYSKVKIPANFFTNTLSWAVTFALVAFAWIFFRATSIGDALTVISNIIHFKHDVSFASIVQTADKQEFGYTSIAIALMAITYMIIVEKFAKPLLEEFSNTRALDLAFCVITGLLIICLGTFRETSFIYFQF